MDYNSMGNEERANALAEHVQKRLVKKGYTVHRYNSFSTQSIYLKVDYGVGGSIRIADHRGKSGLNYRFNLQVAIGGKGVENTRNKVCDRHFYNYGSVDKMVDDIIKFRENRVQNYRGVHSYLEVVDKEKRGVINSSGFWRNAIEIKPELRQNVKKWLKHNQFTREQMDEIVERLRKDNEKLNKILKATKGGWEAFTDEYLDLVLYRYNDSYPFPPEVREESNKEVI